MQEDIFFTQDGSVSAAAGPPLSRDEGETRDKFELVVVFTSFDATLSALRHIRPLVDGLSARINVLVLQVVPHPLVLAKPPVAVEFVRRRLRHLANQSPVELAAYHYLCRDGLEALTQTLKPASVVVIGGSKRWWNPTKEQKLARKLRQHGHCVLFLEAQRTSH